MSQKTAAHLKPRGAQIEPATCRNGFFKSAQQSRESRASDSCTAQLTARTFDDVIDRAHDHKTVGPPVDLPGDVDEVCADHVFVSGRRSSPANDERSSP